MGQVGRLRKKGGGKGFVDLLIGQFLLATLLYMSVAFYEMAPTMTLGATFFLLAGSLYFSWRGMKVLWYKNRTKQK